MSCQLNKFGVARFELKTRHVVVCLFSVFLVSLIVETSEGQLLFRRRREQLKAEMKWELQQQLNANLDSQVESARADLSQAASDQIKLEAAALKDSLKVEIAAMRMEAEKIVAEEKRRIAQQAAKEIASIKSAADQKVDSVKKELKVTTMTSIAKAEDELKKALENYSKVLENKNSENLVQFEKKTANQFGSLKSEMEKLINKDVAGQVESAIKKQIATSNQQMEKRINSLIEKALAKQKENEKNQPEDQDKSPAQDEKQAILNRVPRIAEEADEDDA